MATLIRWFLYLWVLIRKEFLAILVDPANRVTLIAPVFIQAVLFGYAASYDVNHVDYAVLDQSRSQSSREEWRRRLAIAKTTANHVSSPLSKPKPRCWRARRSLAPEQTASQTTLQK